MEHKRKINGVRANAQEEIITRALDQFSKGERLDELKKNLQYIERKFVIGIITNDTYCKWAFENFSTKLLESRMAKTLANWVFTYYKEYQKAPLKDIEGIYYEQLKSTNLPKELAEEIEQDILPSLSNEYENSSINIDYLLKQTENYLTKCLAENRINESQALIDNNELEEAISLLNIEPITGNHIDKYMLTVEELKAKGIEKPKILMKPWLREGETTLLYSEAGVGKSLLAMLVAYVLGLEKFDDIDIDKWQVKNPTGTVYINGELTEAEMIERLESYSYLGKQKKGFETIMLNIPNYGIESGKDFDLSKRETQKYIINWLKTQPNYKLLIVDSISTVCSLESENDNSEWNKKINPFLKDLRALGVASIIQHHAGKDNKKGLRGASSMSAMAHNIIRLTNHQNKENGSAWFKVDNSEKQRAAGKQYEPFNIKFTSCDDRTEFEITEGCVGVKDKTKQIKHDLLNRKSNKEIRTKYNLKAASNVTFYKNSMIAAGELQANGEPTRKGLDLLKEWNDDNDFNGEE